MIDTILKQVRQKVIPRLPHEPMRTAMLHFLVRGEVDVLFNAGATMGIMNNCEVAELFFNLKRYLSQNV